jgi:DNA-binding MarR family transcriptional regulator
MDASDTPQPALDGLPGHYIRRLHQIAVALFLHETEAHGLTPLQFAALQALAEQPGIEQRTLAELIGLDTSTTAGVVDRLEDRGLLLRAGSPHDRRVRLLALTAAGSAALAGVEPAVLLAQQRLLAPLTDAERADFLAMLRLLVDAPAPAEPPGSLPA